MTNEEVTKAARHWIKQNKKRLIESFCNGEIYKAEERPVTIFMAGTPGAEKLNSLRVWWQLSTIRWLDLMLMRSGK